MDIQTKRVYEPADPGDGLRVRVDRVWPRGLSKTQVPEPLTQPFPLEAEILGLGFGSGTARVQREGQDVWFLSPLSPPVGERGKLSLRESLG